MKKISHDEFVVALAQQLKADTKVVNSRLAKFVESLQASLKEKGRVSIEGLGEFVLNQDKITFEPSEILALEINYKHAGMEAIEIMPPHEKKLQDKKDDAAAEAKPVEPKPGKSAEEKDDEKRKNISQQKAQPPVTTEPEKSEPKPESKIPEGVDDPFDLDEPADEETEATPIEIFSESDLDFEPVSDEPTKQQPKKRSGSKATIFSLTAMLAVLVVAMYLYQTDLDLPFNLPGSNQAEIITLPEPQDVEPPVTSENETGQGEQLTEEERFQEDQQPPDSQAEDDDNDSAAGSTTVTAASSSVVDDESPYGLYGNLEELRGAFTIVVHSLPYRQAGAERDRLEQAGFRAVLNYVALDDGRETWRVGIGQFETMDDATRAVQRLDEPYRSNNFVARIRR